MVEGDDYERPDQHGDTFTRPDPSRMTTAQLLREVASSRAIVEAKYEGKFESLSVRLTAFEVNLNALIAISKEVQATRTQVLEARLHEMEKLIANEAKAMEERSLLRFNAMERHSNTLFVATERAAQKLEEATEKRFYAVNEFRKTLSDQVNSFLQEGEYTAQHTSLDEKVNTVSRTVNMLMGGLILVSFAMPIFMWFAQKSHEATQVQLSSPSQLPLTLERPRTP